MKKHLLLFAIVAATMMLAKPAQAQDLTVADGTETTSDFNYIFPFYADYQSLTQMIYPATMLEEMNGLEVSGLKFYLTGSNSTAITGITVKLKEVSATSIGWNFESVSDAQTVFTGSLTSANSVIAIDFTNYYTYNGGNLLVSIETDGTSSEWWENTTFYGISYNGGLLTGADYYQSGDIEDYDYYDEDILLKATFEYVAVGGCPKPGTITASGITDSEITISWEDVDEAQQYIIYVNGEEIGTTSELSYTITDLNASTTYTIGVATDCGDEASYARNILVNTNCGNVQLPVSFGFEEDAYESFPNCWFKTVPCVDDYGEYPQIDEGEYYAHTGIHVLYFSTDEDEYAMAATPTIEHAANDLHVTFYATCYTDGSFQVGVITDPMDPETFIPLISEDSTYGTAHMVEYSFNTSTIDFDGYASIAIRGTWSVEFDDITITAIGDNPGDEPGDNPGDEPGDNPGDEPGDNPGDEPGDNPGDEPGDNPGDEPGDNPGDEPGDNPGDEPGDNPGDNTGIGSVETMSFGLYPNPASESVSVSTEGSAQVTLIDMNGRTCGSWTTEGGELRIDLSQAAKGAYFVRVVSAAGTATSKLIVR